MLGLCFHLCILVKQTRIESRATVYIVKNDRLVSRMRHQRNVIRDPIQEDKIIKMFTVGNIKTNYRGCKKVGVSL